MGDQNVFQLVIITDLEILVTFHKLAGSLGFYNWEEMSAAMARVYELDEKERQMADILYRCASLYQSGFADLFARTTARYLFHTIEMTPQTLAFLLNFWYNSYSSFMASFVGYVPFHIRLQKASGS